MWTRNVDLSRPGEYGSEKPDGWVVIKIPELSNQTIYLTSENFAKLLTSHHRIPAENIVTLNRGDENFKQGIREEKLPGREGLQEFHTRLQKIDSTKNPVLIHCKQGVNRTPVAAVIYLIGQKIPPQRAVELVTQAYQTQRDPSFVLNKRGHYDYVLAEVGVVTAKSKRHQRQHN